MYLVRTLSIISVCALIFCCSSVDETLPTVTPIYPADGTTLVDEDINIRWAAVKEANYYQMQLGTRADFSDQLIIDINNTSATEAAITSYRFGELYYWRVRYRTADKSWSSWNGPWRFATYIGAPAPKNPTENDYLHYPRPRFSWSSIREAESYDLVIYAGTDESTVRFSIEHITANHSTIDGDLDHSTEYSWKVRARYPQGITGVWSELSSFTVVDAWKRSCGLYVDGYDFRTYAAVPFVDDMMIIGGDARIWMGTDVAFGFLLENGSMERAYKIGLRPRDDIASLVVLENTIVAAITTSTVERTDRNPWVVRIDQHGAPIWQTFLRSEGEQSATDLLLSPDGSIMVSGTAAPARSDTSADAEGDTDSKADDGTGYATLDGLLIRFESDGTARWMKRYSGDGDDSFSSMCADTEHLYVAGTTDSFESDGKGIVLLKLTLDGEISWAKLYDGPLDESVGGPDALMIADDSTIHIAASSARRGKIGGSMLALELDTDGVLRSAIELSGDNRSFATSIAASADGAVLIGGNVMADSPIAGGLIRTPKVIKIGSDGIIHWQRGTSGAYPHTVESIYARDDGCVIAAGWWYEYNMDSSWLMKIDGQGRFPPDPASIELIAQETELEISDVEFSLSEINYRPWKADGKVELAELDSRLTWP